MINSFRVENFKSIKNLELNCCRVNLFIGKPNTGKSNILEAVGMLSLPYFGNNLKTGIRLEDMSNLFYDSEIGKEIAIEADPFLLSVKHTGINFVAEAKRKDNQHLGFRWEYDFGGQQVGAKTGEVDSWRTIKLYKFKILEVFPRKDPAFLYPPYGDNLSTILLTHPEPKTRVADLLREFDLRMVFQPQENKIIVQKNIAEVVIQFPYSMISDTLQRLIFHLTAIESNKDSTILFEEPESHAFPFYIKELAETIALDDVNQYFISTHNPYLLLSILEKAKKEEVSINLVHFADYQTKVKSLSENQIKELLSLGSDVFFNIDKLIAS